jgi:hypothetical protein
MRTQKISFKGAYLAKPSYVQVKYKLGGPDEIDNTQNLFKMLNPKEQNSDIVLFRVVNDWIADNKFPEVILTNDGKGEDAARYQKEIKNKWDEHFKKTYGSSLEELRAKADEIISKNNLKTTIEDIEAPDYAHSKRALPDNTVYREPYVSDSDRLIKFINHYFNAEMYEKSKEFYKSLKIQTIKPENLLEEGAKILKSIRKYSSKKLKV